MNRKSQAAIEFITTYGWAILSVLIVISALYYYGFLSFNRFIPQECNFPSQFNCFEYMADDTGSDKRIRFMLVNGIGESLNITNAGISGASCAQTPDLNDVNYRTWQDGGLKQFNFTGCTGFARGDRVEAKFQIGYCSLNTPGCPHHAINGEISAIVG